MITSLEEWQTKAKVAPSPHEVRLSPLDTNTVFQCLGEKAFYISKKITSYTSVYPQADIEKYFRKKLSGTEADIYSYV